LNSVAKDAESEKTESSSEGTPEVGTESDREAQDATSEKTEES
jgi:hypothetical protein